MDRRLSPRLMTAASALCLNSFGSVVAVSEHGTSEPCVMYEFTKFLVPSTKAPTRSWFL